MLNKEIAAANNIVIFAHKNLDGDALGSLLAMGYICKNEFGKEPVLAFEGVIPDNLRFMSNKWWLKKAEDIKDVVYDLAISLDTGTLEMQNDEEIRAIWANAKRRIKIDHHMNSPEIGDVNIIMLSAATCEIIANIAVQNGWSITPDIANALYLGILTDTGRFTVDATTPNTMRTAAMLMECGNIAQQEIAAKLSEKKRLTFSYNVETLARTLFNDTDEIGFTTFSVKKMDENDRPHREIAWLHQQILSVDTIKISVIFKEVDDGKIAVSMRSKEIPINGFAESFGGGGHSLAASFTFGGTLPEAVAQILPKLNSLISDACL